MKLRSLLLPLLFVFMGSLGPYPASAQVAAGVQSLESIQAAAEDFVRARLPRGSVRHYVSAGRLDPRLRLHACGVPLETFSQTPDATRVTVGVRCPAGNVWTLYVPVSVEVEARVLVLRRALPRGARVEPGDVEPQLRRLAGSAASFLTDTAALQGHRLKRSVPVGGALTLDMLAPDVLVRRGQQVTLIASSGSVEIRAQGQALSDGVAAERVRVRNLSSQQVVEGIVEDAAIVRVAL